MNMVGIILMLPYEYGRHYFDAVSYDMIGVF